MCNKKSLPGHDDHVQRSSMIDDMIKEEEEEEDELIKHLAARKSRTKTRKPKFLSLRSQLMSEDDGQSYRVPNKITSRTAKARHRRSRRPQLNLFPLHPETRVNNDFEDKGYMQQDENVALLFESDGGATLNGLLTSTTTTATATTSTMSSDLEEAESFSYYKGREEYREETECDIVRTAMRSRERETSVEKWVCFSELVEGKREEDCLTSPTTSTTGTRGGDDGWNVGHQRRSSGGKGLSLALKLDYEEILNAWSDKGPLYIDGGDSPQTVPDLLHQQDHQLFDLHENSSTPNGSGGNLWRVPEEDGSLKMKMEQRETSMLRYKEKRRNRLYSKRIRYQVRKLNAEKRPRMKEVEDHKLTEEKRVYNCAYMSVLLDMFVCALYPLSQEHRPFLLGSS